MLNLMEFRTSDGGRCAFNPAHIENWTQRSGSYISVATRALALLTPVTLVGLYSLACSPPPSCFDGTWPSNGATGVPADTLLQVVFGQDPSEFPALPPGVTLFDETAGALVDITVTADGRTLTAVPAAPLIDDHVYILTGVDRVHIDFDFGD